MKGLNQISFIIFFALLLSCSGGKQGETHNAHPSESYNPYEIDSLAYGRWGDPSSPYRDEERYISFLNEFLAGDSLPEAVRLRAEERLRRASLNRKGAIAADFRYIDRDDATRSLHTTRGKNILLIFYDPECGHCTDILRYLADAPSLNKAIADGSLTVLAIYAEGKRDIWDSTKVAMPANWTVGYDLTGVLDRDLYDLPAMPYPFLLDSTYRVLLKDPTPARLLSRL